MSSENPYNDFPVIIYYSRKDIEGSYPSRFWLDRLVGYLHKSGLQNSITMWSDTSLRASMDWKSTLRRQLRNAQVIVLLVSPDFLTSEFFDDSTLPELLERKKRRREGVVLPIILSDYLFDETKFKYPDPWDGPEEFSLSNFHPVNPSRKPLNRMSSEEQEAMLLDIAHQIVELARQSVASMSAPEPLPETTSVNKQNDNADHLITGSSLADALIVWDPEVVDHKDYVTLITALGDLVRSQGGIGVERIDQLGIEISVSEDILI